MYGGRSGRAKGKAPKSKKLKCILCQAKGHDSSNCPLKDQQEQVLKQVVMKPTLGFGKTHKTSRKAGSILSNVLNEDGDADGTNFSSSNMKDAQSVLEMFLQQDEQYYNTSTTTTTSTSTPCSATSATSATTTGTSTTTTATTTSTEPLPLPFIVYDAGCDLGSIIDTITSTITGSNLKKAKVHYMNTIQPYSNTIYGANICRYSIKPDKYINILDNTNNQRIQTILETDPNTFFVIGLGPGFFMNTTIINSATTTNTTNTTNTLDYNDIIQTYEGSEDYKNSMNALIQAIQSETCNPNDNDKNNKSNDMYDDKEVNDTNNSRNKSTSNLYTNQRRIVGLYCKLDYTPDTCTMIPEEYHRHIQLIKLRISCQVARICNLPIQIKLLPSAPNTSTSSSTNNTSNSDDNVNDTNDNDNDTSNDSTLQMAEAYKQVIQDFAKVLLEMTTPSVFDHNNTLSPSSSLRVHVSSWNGTELHMNHLLQAFPDVLYIGLNAMVGYTKQKNLHECSFSIPIERCLLESDGPNAIPNNMIQQQQQQGSASSNSKKKVFCHAGCILYTAMSIAEHKRDTISAYDIIRITSNNTLQLYGGDNIWNGLHQRAEQVMKQLSERRNEQLKQQHEDEGSADNDYNDDDTDQNERAIDQTKKKNKTRNGKNNNNNNHVDDDHHLINEEELLAELAAEMGI
jgi:hypothetical protein